MKKLIIPILLLLGGCGSKPTEVTSRLSSAPVNLTPNRSQYGIYREVLEGHVYLIGRSAYAMTFNHAASCTNRACMTIGEVSK